VKDRPDDWLPAKSLYAKATRKPKHLGLVHWFRSRPLDGELVLFYRPAKGRKHLTAQQHPAKSRAGRKHAKSEKEPWLLVVSPSLKAYSAVQVVDYYQNRMQIEDGFRDTKSTHYGLDLASENRIDTERRANLLLIAALVIFALWLTGNCLKGTDIERQIKVNSGQNHSRYSVIFLARIVCRYVVFVLSGPMLEQAQALLVGYFGSLEGG
jgi:Transposase DDE domain